MLAVAFGVAGLVAGLGGLWFTLRSDRRDVGDRRHQLQLEGQHEGEKLSEFVVRSVEQVIGGFQGLNEELQQRAEAVVTQLLECTRKREELEAANDELRQRVNSLEEEVVSLRGQADDDRKLIQRLEREIAELQAAS